jgi:hypothetical protein
MLVLLQILVVAWLALVVVAIVRPNKVWPFEAPATRLKAGGGVFVAGVMVLGTIASIVGPADDAASEPTPPERQQAFVATVTDSIEHWDEANEAKRKAQNWAALRGDAIEQALGGERHAVNWVGTVAEIKAQRESALGADPGAFVTVRLDGGGYEIHLQSDYDTMIPKNSGLYDTVQELSAGDRIWFSGAFLPAADRAGVYEDSVTTAGRMTSPEYEFQFVAIGDSPASADNVRKNARSAAERLAAQEADDG